MKDISLLIKPVSGSCNLSCGYCFYRDLLQGHESGSHGHMTPETLETLVRHALAEAERSCAFAFQGGEPTLAGLDFYQRLVELQRQYNINKVEIRNSIQTNGTTITPEWTDFLAKHSFLVGLSLDGDALSHDLHRRTAPRGDGEGTHAKVMRAAEMLNRAGVQFNILCVVTANTARHLDRIYNFFAKKGFEYLQFIPCLDPLGEPHGGRPYSLSPQQYAKFLKQLFDRWYGELRSGKYRSIRLFDDYLALLRGYPPTSCTLAGVCASYYVVEASGKVYPCDFYVMDKYELGDIHINSFAEMAASEAAVRFVDESRPVNPKCRSCRALPLCRGGCRRDREPVVDGAPALNFYCQSYLEFFEYAASRLVEVARLGNRN